MRTDKRFIDDDILDGISRDITYHFESEESRKDWRKGRRAIRGRVSHPRTPEKGQKPVDAGRARLGQVSHVVGQDSGRPCIHGSL